MPWYRKLPPISRTPTPPPDVLRRLRPFSCNPFEPVEVDGQDRDDGDDEDGNTVPTNSNGHSFPLVKGIREPKKHYLPVGKDSTGRSKRQRLGKHPQTEEVSPDIVLENESVSEWDTLGSIFVAGGFLMMGNWFGNRDDGGKDEKDEVGERDNENLAETRTEQVTNDTRSVVSGSGREGNFNSMGGECVDRLQSNEQTTTKRPQRPNVRHSYNTNPIVKGRLRTATPLKHDEFSEVLDVDNCNIGEPIFRRSDNHNDDTGPNDPNRTVSTSKTIEDSRGFADTRKTPQLTDPLSPDNKGKSVEKVINSTIPEDTINKQAVSPTSMVESVIPCTALDTNKPRELPSEDTELRKKAEGDEWLKGLTFEILALPERIATSVRGRDFFDSGSHKLCWDELKEKINQGLGIGPNLPHSTVIVNWKFRLKNQADLDICIERLIPHGRPIHHIVVLFCSTDTNASATPGAKIDEESVTKEVVKILEAQDRNYWMGKNVTSSVADLIAGSNADVWSKLPGEARDSIRQNSSNPQQALPHSPAPLPENPTTLNPTWTSISHIPIAPKPPHWGTPNFPSTSPSKKIQTTANNTQLYYSSTARKVTTEQLLAQLMAPGNKSGNKTDESSAPPSTDGASTPAAAKWKSKPPPRNPSARTRNAVPSEIFQVHRNTRSSSRAAKLSLLDQPQKEAEASKASDQPSSSTASADTHKSLPKRRGSPRGQSRAKKRLAKSTDPASNLQGKIFWDI
ncbi:hypothetical protein L873DRAFT_1796258 [Choiromyces venosus 120613-1]|uniref:Uncharacterized protein n=1 Tax=Choiromyces venosus 120613-1 TaxID=1336337 RepID=A0A3N4IWI7_9PEZI|nr:hypothetical protein L873DRAFT_1796258 [Choiromyces venosus 120613-1]